MFRSTAIIFSVLGVVPAAFGQDSGGWRKFGSSSGDQAYSVNQAPPVQNAQPAPAPSYARSEVILSAGTLIAVRVNEKLSSDRNQPGDFFSATLTRPLVANGLVIAQPGQNVAGRVAEAVDAEHGGGTSRLRLELTELSLADGQQVPIRTQLMEYERGKANGRDAGVVLGTTAAGAGIGAIAGGGFGAGVGAIAGAVAGAIGVMATRAHATEIHQESILTFRLVDTVAIATDRSGGAFQSVRQQDYRTQQPDYRGQQPDYRGQQPGYGAPQPVQRAVAPPAPYGYYGGGYGYYDPFYSPYYYPYGGYYYGYGPAFGASFVFRSGPRGVIVRGGGRRR
ncbi:MAG: hypothetical protein JWO19_1429 [Bryobacterales bacterium]|nr:hypothetical protein [Bryobacterales bacterium]